MKKFIAVLLAVLLCFSFVACNNTQTTTGGADDSWTKVEAAKKLVMGLDDAFPPMGYVDTETGEIIGFDIDIATEVCKRLNIELKLQPIDWNNKATELDNGNVDCLWNGFSKTPEREEKHTLSDAYMQNNQVIIVKADSEFEKLSDLSGKTVGVQTDSSAEDALNKNEEFKSSLKEVVVIDDYSKAILEIKNGTIDAIAIDEVVARFYLTNEPDTYKLIKDDDGNDASLAVEDYVIGFRKADIALRDKINATLIEMAKDGTLATISTKWFGQDVTVIGK